MILRSSIGQRTQAARAFTRATAASLALLAASLGGASDAHAWAAPGKIADYTGDGKSDLMVWRPTDGNWYMVNSANGSTSWTQFGLAGDIPVAADFSYQNAADGKADRTVWRPTTATWHWLDSQTGTYWTYPWGGTGDIPVAGDFDGDGKSDIAIWRHTKYGSDAAGMWWVKKSSNWTTVTQQWGQAGDIPVPCDYDNDGKSDYAVFRPSNGTWYIIKSSTGAGWNFVFGQQGDIPVTGDYDLDGKCDPSYWRPSNGTWYVVSSSSWTYTTTQWGLNGDRPQPTDHDGDGKTDLIVWRPSNGTWYGVNSSNGATWSTQWGVGSGINSDVALPNLAGSKNQTLVTLVGQQQSNWCSSASTQMVAGYSQVAISQCAEANAYTGRTDCCTNASSQSDTAKCNKTEWWRLTSNGFTLTDLWGPSALSFAQIQDQLNGNRPVIYAWAWTGGGGHTMVLVNAWVTSNGQQWVTRNDPSPVGTGSQVDQLYSSWVNDTGYTHWRDSYNITKN